MIKPASSRARCIAVASAILLAALPRTIAAQLAGENVNMVTGTQWPGGDPYLQRQNEPSVAISTVNPDHLLAGANDYRTVDLPNPNSADETGDAWLGVFKSFDGGQTWQSNLIPGYPADPNKTAPLFGLTAASDPLVRAAPGGLFLYSGIVFNRGTNVGKVFVSRFLDVNNKENGDTTKVVATDPIQYVDTSIVDSGTSGQFEDKPWIAVDVPRGSKTCGVPATVNGTASTVTIPAFNVYYAYAVFTGSSTTPSSKVMFATSNDCGKTWGKPQKVSESNSINQGTNVVVDPVTGAIYVAWRRFQAGQQSDAIMMVKSTNQGATFTKAYPVTASFLPFDQTSSGTEFRTESLPGLAISVVGNTSWVHVAWAQRPSPGADAQVVLATSTDGVTWPAPVPLDVAALADDYGHQFTRGHQFMPALTFSQGRLVALYYDSRLDHTRGYYRPNNPFVPDVVNGKFYTEDRGPIGELAYNPAAVRTPALDDAGLTDLRHTIDVRVAYAFANPTTGFASPSFTSAPVSQFPIGIGGNYGPGQTVPIFDTATELQRLRTDPLSGNPFTPPYLSTDSPPRLNLTDTSSPADILMLEQLAANAPNLPMFAQGTVPFIGDYIDVASLAFVPVGGAPFWAFATAPSPAPVFHAVWTSNQDVVVPIDPATGLVNWKLYTPPGTGGTSTFDPNQQRPACVVGNEGSRNQNIYTARVSEGLRVSSPQPVKPLNVPRAFVIAVQNTTDRERAVRLSVGYNPSSLAVSFTSTTSNAPLITTVYGRIPKYSTAYRTLFVPASANTFASVGVNVQEVQDAPSTCQLSATVTSCPDLTNGLSGSITLNPPAAPGAYSNLVQPDSAPGDVTSSELYLATVSNATVSNSSAPNATVSNATVSNATVSNATVSNATVSNATVSNSAVWNATVSNATVSNATVSNATVSNATVSNATVSNSALSATVSNATVSNATVSNANVTAAAISDATTVVKNTGNTTHTYRIKLVGSAPAGSGVIQLILTKTYATPASAACVPAQQGHTALVSTIDDVSSAVIPLDTFLTQATDPNIPDPTPTNVTLALAPGETGQITLRGALDTASMANVAGQVISVAVPHAGGSFASPLFMAVPTSQASPVVGAAYSVQLVYGGDTSAAYTLVLLSGQLPPGLTLGSNGLSGTPQQGGAFTFTLQATDASNTTVSKVITLSVGRAQSSTAAPTVSPSNPVYGQQVTLAATISGAAGVPAPTGTASFYDLGASCSASVPPQPSTGALASPTTLSVGAHCIAAYYPGDSNYLASAAQATVTVAKGATATTSTASPSPAVYGQSVTLSASTVAVAPSSGTPSGATAFYDLGAACPSQLPAQPGSGALTSPVSTLSVGTHCIAAYFAGDGNFGASAGAVGLTVKKGNSVTAFGSVPSSIVYGQAFSVSATVAPQAPSAGTPSGTVSYYDLAGASCPSALPGSLPTPFATAAIGAQAAAPVLTPGVHCLLGLYAGDANFNGSAIGGGFASAAVTVNPATTATTITSGGGAGPITAAYGQTVPLSISVAAVAPGTGTPGGNVTVTDPAGNVLASGALVSGTVAFNVATTGLVPGSNLLTASYAPSSPAQFASSAGGITINLGQGTVSVTVATTTTSTPPAPLASAVYGQGVKLTATVTPAAGGTPTGIVTLYDGATVLGSFPIGAAAISFATLTVGPHSFSAVYSGDVHFAMQASGTLSFPVSAAGTATALSVSPSPASFTQAITLTATVTVQTPSTASPDGSVSYYDLGATCPSPLPASPSVTALGSAAVGTPLVVPSLAAGNHCLAAYYASTSGNFLASRGAAPSVLTVNGYTFTGFLSPLTTAQLLTSATYSSYSGSQNYGSAVPFKWTLASGGTAVTSLSVLVFAKAYVNTSKNCKGPPVLPPVAGEVTPIYSPGAGFTGKSSLQFNQGTSSSPGYYQFNWDTSVVTRGCYTMALQFNDGSTWATNVNLQ